jgi:SAP domain
MRQRTCALLAAAVLVHSAAGFVPASFSLRRAHCCSTALASATYKGQLIDDMTVPLLKQACEELGQPKSGKKSVLQERVIAALAAQGQGSVVPEEAAGSDQLSTDDVSGVQETLADLQALEDVMRQEEPALVEELAEVQAVAASNLPDVGLAAILSDLNVTLDEPDSDLDQMLADLGSPLPDVDELIADVEMGTWTPEPAAPKRTLKPTAARDFQQSSEQPAAAPAAAAAPRSTSGKLTDDDLLPASGSRGDSFNWSGDMSSDRARGGGRGRGGGGYRR